MLRRKKNLTENAPLIFSVKNHKIISINFNKEDATSPYLLNIPEKLAPISSSAWKPSKLESLLSNPLKELRNKTKKERSLANPKIQIDFEPIWDEQENAQIQKLELKSLFKFLYKIHPPEFRTSKFPVLPKLKLPNFKFTKKKEKQPTQTPFILLHAWQKALAGFAIVALILVLPLKVLSAYSTLQESQKQIVDSGSLAFKYLGQGQEALKKGDFISASEMLQSSLEAFSVAQKELNKIHPALRTLLYLTPKIGDKLKSGEELMLAGTNLSLGTLPILYLFSGKEQVDLNTIKTTMEEAAPRFAATNQSLMAVNPLYLPEDSREQFEKIRQTIFFLNSDLQKLKFLSQNLFKALGQVEEKTYLVIFQNNNEIRPTGGFIGSYAELKVKNGKITKLDIPGEGPYKLQGTLTAFVMSPTPLQLMIPRWEMQDANWFPDFPESAKKIMWFYERSGGSTVDGVIAIDTNPLLDILKITGPIAMPSYNKTITTDNFIDEIQKNVEFEYDKIVNQPKQIISDLTPLILEKLFSDKNNLLPFLGIVNKNLENKHIQFYFSEPELERQIVSEGWAGEMKNNPSGDFLYVVNSNIGGLKTDRVITQTISQKTKIEEGGSIINEVTLERAHAGRLGDPLTHQTNIDYARFYVPQGSQLLSAEGFNWPEEKTYKVPEKWFKLDEDLQRIEGMQVIDGRSGTVITNEFGKTVFGNWIITKPEEKSIVKISYRLPFKITKKVTTGNFSKWQEKIFGKQKNLFNYSLLTQKQPGASAQDMFNYSLEWPKSWQVVWINNEQISWQNNISTYSTFLNEDKFLGMVFQE